MMRIDYLLWTSVPKFVPGKTDQQDQCRRKSCAACMLPLQYRPRRALQLYGDLCLQAEAENQKSLALYDQNHHNRKINPDMGPDSTRNLVFSCSQVHKFWWTEIDYRALTKCECHSERISCCVTMCFAAPQNRTVMQNK